MKADRLDQLLSDAQAAGILPAAAARPKSDDKPWPLTLMIGVGAWFSTLPLLAFLVLSMDSMLRSSGAYFFGATLLGAAVYNFRRQPKSAYAEQLSLPVMLAGGGLIGIGLSNSVATSTASLILAAIALVSAALVPRAWLRILLGALACVLTMFGWKSLDLMGVDRFWLPTYFLMSIWLVASFVRSTFFNDGARAAWGATIEATGTGWLLMTLACLAMSSGNTFMIGASFGFSGHATPMEPLDYVAASNAFSAGAAACGGAWLAERWPALRTKWALTVAFVLVGLAFLNPALGAVLLAMSVCMAGGRRRLASAAGCAAAWITGAFYYQLSMPLATKAIVLIGAAAVLGAVAWFAAVRKVETVSDSSPHVNIPRFGQAAIVLSGFAVLVVVNTGIWQKEKLAQSRAIFVELAPVDPRSIMQGDYMALNFSLPVSNRDVSVLPSVDDRHMAVAKLGDRNIATITRMYAGESLAEGELKIALTRRKGRWTMESNAWHFKEGEAERWSGAKYGEFRVDGAGQAMLVGLRGAKLEAL